MAKHIQETNIKTIGGQSIIGTGDIPILTSGVTLDTPQTITAKKTFRTPNATNGNALSPIEVTGGNGTNVVGTSGFSTAGDAGHINIKAGWGGNSLGANPSGFNAAGRGGEIQITAGDAGYALNGGTNYSGHAGNAILQAGSATLDGKAGNVEFKAGNNSDLVGGNIFFSIWIWYRRKWFIWVFSYCECRQNLYRYNL